MRLLALIGFGLALWCAPLVADDQMVADFETGAAGNPSAPGWTLHGPSGWAARLVPATEQNTVPPNHYLRLDYDFTGGNQDGTAIAGKKYLIANCHLPLPANTTALSFRVLGDGSRHALVVSVIDATGQWFNFFAGNPEWEDWRILTVEIVSGFHSHGGGANDGVMHPPLALSSFNLTDNPVSQQVGWVGFDDITAVVGDAGNLFTGRGAHRLTWVVTNPTGQAQRGQLSYRAYACDAPAGAPPLQIGGSGWSCPAHGRVTVRAPVTLRDYGCYWCDGEIGLAGADKTYPFVTTYAAVPVPREDPTLSFGVGVSFAESVLRASCAGGCR